MIALHREQQQKKTQGKILGICENTILQMVSLTKKKYYLLRTVLASKKLQIEKKDFIFILFIFVLNWNQEEFPFLEQLKNLEKDLGLKKKY